MHRPVATGLLVLLLATACSESPHLARGRAREVGEAAERLQDSLSRIRELDRAERNGALGITEPVRTRTAPGWAGERIWHRRANDWEPDLAADPSSPFVNQLTTRYGRPYCKRCPDPWIAFRSSPDGGRTWSPDRPLCDCRSGLPQYDPQIEAAAGGAVFAAWVDSHNRLGFTRSEDHGAGWSIPSSPARGLPSADRPVLASSADGRDVYVAFSSAGDSFVVSSHDGGVTFSRPMKTNRDKRSYFAGGGYVAPDGTVTFAETGYPKSSGEIVHDQAPLGRVRVLTTSSTNGGRTWRHREVDSFREWPACLSRSCPVHYYGPQAVIGGDARGHLLLATNGTLRSGGAQRIYVRRSTDGGATWSNRLAISPPHSNSAFPAAVGTGAGDFRVWFMDDRMGEQDAWNVWYRRSTDGGKTWGSPVRISDGISGTAYKTRRGFREPYGDYGAIAVISTGATIAVWGEGSSYAGPGGTWYNRQTP